MRCIRVAFFVSRRCSPKPIFDAVVVGTRRFSYRKDRQICILRRNKLLMHGPVRPASHLPGISFTMLLSPVLTQFWYTGLFGGFLATDGRSANSFHLTLVQLRQSWTMKQQQCRMTVELHIKRDSLNDMAISRRVRLFAPSFSAHLLLAQLEKPKPDHVQTEDLVVSRCSCSSTATRDRCRAR